MYEYGSGASGLAFAIIWFIISFVLATVGAILVYFLFMRPNNEVKNKFWAWMKDFLNFKKMFVEVLLKVFYVFCAILCTLGSIAFFGLGGIGFLLFLLTITFGNISIRLVYEAALLKIMIWKNTTEINEKLK